jgi:hypothetical protein
MLGLAEETGKVRGDNIEKLDELLAIAVGKQMLEIPLGGSEAENADPLGDPGSNQCFLPWSQPNASALVGDLSKLLEQFGVHRIP